MSGTIIQEQEQYACPECNGVEFISDVQRGDVICRGCSIVVDKILEGTHFLDRGDGPDSRMGSPESRRNTVSTSFRVYDANADMRDKFRRLYNAANSSYDAVEENKGRILSILTRLGFSEHARNDLMFELKKIYAAEKRKGNKVTNIFLVCTALTIKHMKNRGMACSINDIVSIFKESGTKLSSKAVRDYIIESGMSYKNSSAESFIPKYLALLKSNDVLRQRLENIDPDDELAYEKLITSIETIATKLSQIKVNGRKPSVFSVSCLYIATNLVGERYLGEPLISKEEISRFLSVPSTTLREHCRYVMNHLQLNL